MFTKPAATALVCVAAPFADGHEERGFERDGFIGKETQ